MFKLLRYFSLTSLLTFIIISVLLGVFYRRLTLGNLIALGESKNVALTQAFANSLWPQFEPFVTSAVGLSSDALRVQPEIAQLRYAVLALMRELSVVKVKVYNLAGLTVFSTQASQIGEDKSKNAGFLAARDGRVASELTHRDKFSAFEGVIENRDVVSSYIPIRRGGITGPVEGVFELYDDVTPLLQHIDHTQKNVVVGVIGILATLYTVLFFIVQHADHILQRQHGALQEARDELDMRVRERTAELVQANAQLERSNRELRDFAFVASHDLQEPLRKIQTFGDRLKVVCGEALSAQGHDYLERMRNAAGQMQTLIHGLRTFLQMTVTAQPFVPVDLSAMAHEVVSDLGQYIEQVGGHVDMGELPTIEAEPLQIRQLLQHLIDNALKFRQAETAPLVTIRGQRLQAGEQYVKGSAAAAEEWCQITVVDNGIGFDEKYLDRIFTVFQRLHGGDTYDGVGVGLAVCRKIVEHHGGAITAKSTPGEGATFIVTLPLTHSVGDHVECIPLADPVSF